MSRQRWSYLAPIVLAGALIVYLCAWMARELGGGRRAQIVAALLATTAPALLGSHVMLQTVVFDQLAWVVC